MGNQDNRLFGADFVRAGACLIVLVHHLAQRIDYRSALGTEGWRVFNNGGGFGVGLFFVLSGFLLSLPFWKAMDRGEAIPSLRTFFLRRAARILPGFWLVLTLTFVLSFTLFDSRLDVWLWLRYLAGLLTISDWHWTTLFPVDVNGPLWSIGFEVSSYALLPLGFVLLFAFSGRLNPVLGRLAWLAVIGLALAAHQAFVVFVDVDTIGKGWRYGLQGGAKEWMPRFNPFGFFAIFAFGAFAGGVQTLLAGRKSWLFDVPCLVGTISAAIFMVMVALEEEGELYGWLDVPYQFPLMPALVALILVTGPSSVIVGRLLDNAILRYVARVSFGVYVWHYLFLELARELIEPRMVHGTMTDPVAYLGLSAGIVAASFAVATLSYRWLEAPVMAWARGLERPAHPVGAVQTA
jgi:peptidoglycan/LPS O-acetylase OafA/YrhL